MVSRSPPWRLTKLQCWLPLLLLLEFLHRAPFVSLIRLGIMLYSCEMLQLFSSPRRSIALSRPRPRPTWPGSAVSSLEGYLVFTQLHSRVTGRLPPEGGVHIVGVREQCPKSNIVARRRNGRGRLLQREGATRLVVRPMVARSADDRRRRRRRFARSTRSGR